MRNLIALLMSVAFLATLPQAASSADDTDTATILGGWQVIKMEARGKPVSEASWQGMKYEFKKDEFRLWAGTTTPAGLAGKSPLQCPYSLDNESDPRHFNFTLVAGDSRRDVEAIYKIADQRLYLCFGTEGRPKSFETKDTRNLCYVLERLPVPDER